MKEALDAIDAERSKDGVPNPDAVDSRCNANVDGATSNSEAEGASSNPDVCDAGGNKDGASNADAGDSTSNANVDRATSNAEVEGPSSNPDICDCNGEVVMSDADAFKSLHKTTKTIMELMRKKQVHPKSADWDHAMAVARKARELQAMVEGMRDDAPQFLKTALWDQRQLTLTLTDDVFGLVGGERFDRNGEVLAMMDRLSPKYMEERGVPPGLTCYKAIGDLFDV